MGKSRNKDRRKREETTAGDDFFVCDFCRKRIPWSAQDLTVKPVLFAGIADYTLEGLIVTACTEQGMSLPDDMDLIGYLCGDRQCLFECFQKWRAMDVAWRQAKVIKLIMEQKLAAMKEEESTEPSNS